ncbi:MAG TPA: DUF5309 family protein [Candidatus Pelethenecus sp.]|nr:DUF5309 family protein [Candidatus Pelethenecus sp.]
MATNGYNFTYPDVGRRESLLDVLTLIAPVQYPLVTGLSKSKTTNTLHEWIQKSVESVGTNAQFEGGDAPADAANDPTRLQNVTQIFAKTAKITGTELAVDRVGGDRMAEEIREKTMALKNDIEFAILRGSIASGVASVSGSGSARQLKGIKNWITTNVSNYSGATLTETALNDMFEGPWNQTGEMVDAVYTTMKGKRRISGFTAGNTKNIDANDKRLVNAVDIYEADAAHNVKLFAHRHVTVSGDYGTTSTPGFDVLSLKEDTWGVAFYRDPFTKDLAETGDFKAKEIITELTLEAKNEKANAMGRVFF